ncbi:hypothetical protein SDC9_100764 [bioreactor metagenome]|uniref:Uncharacterized protein n=1 Tax=bioreactor metagenome TaxID=1076179 RepID=A0A645AL79_9ZZZZ|nr:hypothetical protein [Rikenellaceae bacterium]
MLTEEQVIEIEHYCHDHNVSRKSRLKELNIDPNHFYRLKRKLLSDSNDLSNGKFLQLNANGEFASAVQQFTLKRKKGSEVGIRTSFLTIELRNERGKAMRIQGEMSAEQLREIMTIM